MKNILTMIQGMVVENILAKIQGNVLEKMFSRNTRCGCENT